MTFRVLEYRNIIDMYERAGALLTNGMVPLTQDTGETSPIQDD